MTAAGPIAVGVMCKPPRPGLSKTRLARDIGAAEAAGLGAAFLRDVIDAVAEAATRVPCRLFGVFTPVEARVELASYFPPGTVLVTQRGEELGEIMRQALADLRRHCPDGALLVGSDVPALTPDIIAQAVCALRGDPDRPVIGPARDGGYYLVGAAGPAADVLFAPMAWSTPDVMSETRRRAGDAHLVLTEVPALLDVDTGADLRDLALDVLADAPPTVGRHTRRALAALDDFKR